MTIYQKMILQDTQCTPDEAIQIEDIMRHTIFHSTLDWQTRDQLRVASQEAQEVLTKITEIVMNATKKTNK